ncbi:MAG: ATP-dependent protease LonB [Candidatus Woesearchaeota archaeon]
MAAKKKTGKSSRSAAKRTSNKSARTTAKKAAGKSSSAKNGIADFKTTKDIRVPNRLIDQVIGQESAINVMKKAASQRRHVLLVGEPGTGKSLLGVALAEMLPKEKLVDILSFKNPNDENKPLVRTAPAKQGREIIARAKLETSNMFKGQNIIFIILAVLAMLAPWWIRSHYLEDGVVAANILFAATFLGGIAFLVGVVFMLNMSKKMGGKSNSNPKLLVDNYDNSSAPFFDATGAHAGALLGDVLHDPFQSGGLGTPAHERVVAGMIHKAHMGVLFIDEIGTLHPATQQELLTAIQEGKFSITGQSERSAGAMVRTEPVPCRFVMIAAGNMQSIKDLHPALRSRIRGYGYEVHMKDVMEDTPENEYKLAQFVAQEVRKDGKIPHFTKDAVSYIVEEARRRANRKNHLTLRLRELGGFIRSAGDIAVEHKAALVDVKHVRLAKENARGLEQQLADRYIENKKDYDVIVTSGQRIGRVNGLAVIGGGGSYSGIILPIESSVTAGDRETKILATGRLGEIAKEAITNVSGLVRSYFGEDLRKYDVFVQFLQTYEGVEGDSASLAVASTIVSALKNIPVHQNVAITGSVSVRGEALPVGGVSAKVDAAIDAGVKKIIVPRSNMQDIIIEKARLKKVTLVPVDNLINALEHLLDWTGKEDLLKQLKKHSV